MAMVCDWDQGVGNMLAVALESCFQDKKRLLQNKIADFSPSRK